MKKDRKEINIGDRKRPILYDLELLFLGAIVGLIFTILTNLFLIPFVMNNFFQKDDLLKLDIYQETLVPADNDKIKYVLSLSNQGKYTAEDVFLSVDWPLSVNKVDIVADNGTVLTQVSPGVGPIFYDDKGSHRLPTNHLNVISQKVFSKNGSFCANIFLNKKGPSSIPFPGSHCAELQYSYSFLGVQVPRAIKVKFSNILDEEAILKRTSTELYPCDDK